MQNIKQKLSVISSPSPIISTLWRNLFTKKIPSPLKIKNYQSKTIGFTLVELIVVIVILAILSTIAFLSFNSYSSSSRDSARLSDLSSISKGLSLYNVVSGKYPKPDSYITITASGTPIGYQGKAGANVISNIKGSANGFRDPIDNNSYYTYSTNINQSKYQLLGFLEDSNNISLSFNSLFYSWKDIGGEYANALDYSKRFSFTKGDTIGILLSSGSLDPVENQKSDSFSGIDIVNTTGSYTVQLNNKIKLSGSGIIQLQLSMEQGKYYTWETCNNSEEIQIGTQCWKKYDQNIGTFTGMYISLGGVMNMDIFLQKSIQLKGFKWCYSDNNSNCTDSGTGAFYTWDMAMNGELSSNNIPSGVKGVCGTGFHIPSDNEFKVTEKYLGCTDYKNYGYVCDGLGYSGSLSTSKYGGLFSKLNGGMQYDSNSSILNGLFGRYWTSTITLIKGKEEGYIQRRTFRNYMSNVTNSDVFKIYGSNVRCLKD
ncbi:MAG: FISUMP domain-containing protein [Candidatus Gracilibacteria bacterium]|nr:FISUMP domain-containing protein [Candidatus Gracilibacteria bacterium]MDD2909028.1 FISUMP domain-containing protein [Candidatus Gracilibacteria bacterium]